MNIQIKEMKKRLVGLVLVCSVLVGISGGVANAAISDGAKCTKVGRIVTVKTKTKTTSFICVKNGTKKVWRVRSATNSKFPNGLYFVVPSLDHPGGEIQVLDGSLPTPLKVVGIGYDVIPALAISTTPDNAALIVTRANGRNQRVDVPGLYRIVRPSLAGDGTKVAIQASETPIASGDPNPFNDSIYVVDIPAGTWRRIGDVPIKGDASTQSEQPAFFPSGDRVAYWAASNECLVVKVRNATTGAELLTIARGGIDGCYQPQRGILDGPRFHIAVSADSTKILIPGQMQIYDSTTGVLLKDLHKVVLDGLEAAGYQSDSRFPGAAGGGTFPLSGSFSPDGRFIAFDGAVQKNGVYGQILARIGIDGTGFTVLRALIPVNPSFSNNFNFSQLLPRWR